MKLYNPDGTDLMTVSAIDREDDYLVLKGEIFGAMPVRAHLRPAEARAFLKLLSPRTIWFALTLLFRA